MSIDIASVGMAAQWFQTTVSALREVAKEMNIEPAARINGIDHYSTSDLHKMRPRFLPSATQTRGSNAKPATAAG